VFIRLELFGYVPPQRLQSFAARTPPEIVDLGFVRIR
jgi:hypothetical protein